jgi:hypothetical protein
MTGFPIAETAELQQWASAALKPIGQRASLRLTVIDGGKPIAQLWAALDLETGAGEIGPARVRERLTVRTPHSFTIAPYHRFRAIVPRRGDCLFEPAGEIVVGDGTNGTEAGWSSFPAREVKP